MKLPNRLLSPSSIKKLKIWPRKMCYISGNRTFNNHFTIFWDFFMFYQIFLSPQAKRCAINTYKYGVYKLSHKFSNDLRLSILGN